MPRDGRDGMPGLPGPIPKHEWNGTHIRFQKSDGNWGDWVDVLGEKGITGPDGKSAYELAVDKGFQGTVEEFLMSLKGEQGRSGKTAYTLALESGFRGTVTEWLLSLNGKDGKDGKIGKTGKSGIDGKDGEKGDKGDIGLSAYEVWLSLGNQGTENDFFEWIADKVREKIKTLPVEKTGAGPIRLKLSHLTDVDVAGASNGDRLAYSNGKWIPAAGGGGGNVDSVNGKTGVVILDINDIGGVAIDIDTLSGDGTATMPLAAKRFSTCGFSAISPEIGQQGSYYVCTQDGEIIAWNIVVDSGDVTVKVWKVSTGTVAPTDADSINTSGISISTGTAIRSTDLTDFSTTTVNQGDIFGFEITANSANRVAFQLEISTT